MLETTDFDDTTGVAVSVIIPAAGRGSRLGLERPKAMIECAGRMIIDWQLALCREVEDVIVVVGFRGDELAELVTAHRPDATVVVNPRYETTLTASSVAVGAAVARHPTIVSLDGDVLVHPADWAALLTSTSSVVGIGDASAGRDAVLVDLDPGTDEVVSFRRHRDAAVAEEVEWAGVCRTPRAMWEGVGRGHVYETLERHLPLTAVRIRTQEVDYPQDLPLADDFAEHYLSGVLDGR